MIYKISNKDNFDIEINFTDVIGLSSYKFLSFAYGDTNPTSYDISPLFSIQSNNNQSPTSLRVTVPEPSTAIIFIFSIVALLLNRGHYKPIKN